MSKRLEWLETYGSEKSRITYRSALKAYFRFIYLGELEAIEQNEERLIRHDDLEVFTD